MLRTAKILIGAALAALIATPALAQTMSGCLDNSGGTLYNVREGATPFGPCKAGDALVSWNKEGPKGEKGDTGAPGTHNTGAENSRVMALRVSAMSSAMIMVRTISEIQ